MSLTNEEKNELTRIVKNIPKNELNKTMSDLWYRYAPAFNYQTFKNYLMRFRGIEPQKKNCCKKTIREIFAELNKYKFEKPKLNTFIIRITEPDLIQLKQKFLKEGKGIITEGKNIYKKR